MTIYDYTIKGTAARGQTWEFHNSIEALPGDFALVPDIALRETFMALTEGKAVFGKPGVGCQGPYQFTSLTIERRP